MSSQIEFARALRDFQSEDLQSAAQTCQALLASEPDNAAALHLLGQIAARLGDSDTAIAQLQQALAADPQLIEARYALADLYVAAGHVAEAEAQYRQAIESEPGSAMPWIRLGNGMCAAGLSDEAISAYREAIGRDTGSAEAWARLGMVFLERGQVADAMMSLRRAVKKQDDHVDARNALATALQRSGRADEAIAALEASIAIRSDVAATHKALADLLAAQGRLGEAVDALQRALELEPALAPAHFALGAVAEQTGELEQAAASYARALELQPDFSESRLALLLVRQRLCDWDAVEAFERQTAATGDDMPPLAALSLGLPAERQLAVANRYAASIRVKRATPPASVCTMRPITLAYLSADFCDNPLGRMIASILEQHDRSRLRVAAFSCGPDDGGEVRRRVQGAVDEFVDIRYHSHEAAVREIRTRGVQILIDLAGYARTARPQILAPRAAPIQVGFLGYRGTLGARLNDYIVVDDYLVPEQARPYYTEQPLRMPHGVVVADRPAITAVTRADCRLPVGSFVFCCFNDTRKISREVFACWMQLLRDVPDSVLWLKERSRFPGRRLQAAARESGIDADRLVFAPLSERARYLGEYAHADLFLDSYPCNGGTTALDVLLGGCPVLTCSGDSYVSRLAGSILTSIGMDQLVCTDLASYGRSARDLAGNPARLAGLRQRLSERLETAPFLDARAFAADLETAFEQMLQACAAGRQAGPLRADVP